MCKVSDTKPKTDGCVYFQHVETEQSAKTRFCCCYCNQSIVESISVALKRVAAAVAQVFTCKIYTTFFLLCLSVCWVYFVVVVGFFLGTGLGGGDMAAVFVCVLVVLVEICMFCCG